MPASIRTSSFVTVLVAARVAAADPEPEALPVETVENKPVEPATTPVQLKPAEPPPKPPGRMWTWIAAASAVVFTASGIYFGRKSSSEFDEYATTTDQARFRELRDLIPRHERNANLSFILAGASAIATGVLFYVEGRPVSRTQVSFDPVSRSIVAVGRF